MGSFDFLKNPVSEKEPCGPDLDGQDDFDAVIADIEGKLPQSYLDFINPEKQLPLKQGFDLDEQLSPLLKLLRQSYDLRLLVPAAKLAILAGDLPMFCDAIVAMGDLLTSQWEAMHPRATSGAFFLRESQLSRLNETPTVVLPLQNAPFCNLPRLGKVSYRTQLLATKAVSPRADEPVMDEAALHDALLKRNPATKIVETKHDEFASVIASYNSLSATHSTLAAIAKLFAEKAPADNPPEFDKLTSLLKGFCEFLFGLMQERDPALAPVEAAAAGEAVEGAEPGTSAAAAAPPAAFTVVSVADVFAALKAVEAYYRLNEPSNPATLLVRQSQQLVGKSFIEAMLILNPQIAEKAAIKISGDAPLTISSAQMKTLAQGAAAAPAGDVPEVKINSRSEALNCMQAIEKYYQRVEPSSPIPFLLARGRSYSGRDFAALFKELAP